ncbi:hypothetical protein BHE74_00027266 [Ensete ventricosum]|nr:hypothetical protein BHE74_00027266 [Ensete ventricosum]
MEWTPDEGQHEGATFILSGEFVAGGSLSTRGVAGTTSRSIESPGKRLQGDVASVRHGAHYGSGLEGPYITVTIQYRWIQRVEFLGRSIVKADVEVTGEGFG